MVRPEVLWAHAIADRQRKEIGGPFLTFIAQLSQRVFAAT
jgi:hypothetical protein